MGVRITGRVRKSQTTNMQWVGINEGGVGCGVWGLENDRKTCKKCSGFLPPIYIKVALPE